MSNDDVIAKAMRIYIASPAFEKSMTAKMSKIADAVMSQIEDTDSVPIETHNLKDSTGIGVYANGVLKRYIPTPKADEPKDCVTLADGKFVMYGEFSGSDLLKDALNAGIARYGNGFNVVLFSSMPYAEEVDLYSEYFHELKGVMESKVSGVLLKLNLI